MYRQGCSSRGIIETSRHTPAQYFLLEAEERDLRWEANGHLLATKLGRERVEVELLSKGMLYKRRKATIGCSVFCWFFS
jgi:hypothetical protein